MVEKQTQDKLIHIARIDSKKPTPTYLILRQIGPYHYTWFMLMHTTKKSESETPIWGPTTEEAMRLAFKHWKTDQFRPIHCGFRYTLPERDEHGTNALFYQMVASYSSMNGIYFDEELSGNCIVHNASQEARHIWKELLK